MIGGCLIIIGDSDNSNSFGHHSYITNGRNIDLLGGDSDSENANGMVGILTDTSFPS